MPTKAFFVSAVLACLLGFNAARAEDVVVFKDVPTSDEILQAMGVVRKPKTRGLDGPPMTRSVVFTGAAKAEPQVEQHMVRPVAPPVVPASLPPAKANTVAFELTFELNSSELTPEAIRYVERTAEAMNKKPDLRLQISGHTDASGPAAYNDDLSLRRAAAVRNQLTRAYSIDPGRLSVIGEGYRRPLVPADPYAGANRRVEFAPIGAGAGSP